MKNHLMLPLLVFLVVLFSQRAEGDSLYWSSNNGIGRYDFRTKSNGIVTNDYTSGAVDVDASTGDVYFFNNQTDQLRRINASDGGVLTITTFPASSQGLAFDPLTGRLFTTSVSGAIRRTNIVGGATVVLFTSLNGTNVPEEIEVDPVSQFIYWADRNSNSIKRSTTDGTGLVTLASGVYTHGLAIDPARGRMYFSGLFGLYSANLDGSNVQQLVNDPSRFFGIDVSPDGEWIAWADPVDDQIGRVRVDGTGLEVLASTGMDNPTNVVYFIPEAQVPKLVEVSIQASLANQPPKFSGTVTDGPPMGTARLQASLDLGASDPWAEVATTTLDAVGSATFTDAPDPRPQALGAHSDFFRVVTEFPSNP